MKLFARGMVADTITMSAGGTDALKIAYRFNADARWSEIMKLRLEIAKEAEKEHPNAEYMGSHVINMMQIVFGDECVRRMIDFFDGHLESLIETITPVFQYQIYPACEKARKRAIKARKARK